MRAYYATYNGNVYQLDNKQIPNTVMNVVENTHTDVSYMRDRGMLDLNIHISNVDGSAPSNAEVYESTIAKLKTDKTKEIDSLSPIYRVYAEYVLYDEVGNCVVDEGVCVNEITSGTFIFPLGITEENEFVSRLGISLNGRFEKCYRDVRPFGVTRVESSSRFAFAIKRVYVLQILKSALDTPQVKEDRGCVPYVDTRVLPPHWNCTTHSDGRREWADMCHPSIPSMLPATTSINLTEDDYILVYDSAKDGLVFDTIRITFKPKIIHVNIDFTMLDILIAAKEDIDQVLEENVKDETAEPGNTQPSIDDEKKQENADTQNPDTSSKGDSEGDSKVEDTSTGTVTPPVESTGDSSNTEGSVSSGSTTEDDSDVSKNE